MKVVLLRDIPKIGRRGETKEIGDGYATNFLIPKKMVARDGSPDAMKVKREIEERNQHKIITGKLEEETIKSLAGKIVSIGSKANKEGHLFAQVKKEDIIKEIETTYGIELLEENIQLEEHLKTVGDHEVKVSGKNKNFQVKIIVQITSK